MRDKSIGISLLGGVTCYIGVNNNGESIVVVGCSSWGYTSNTKCMAEINLLNKVY